LYYRAFSLIEWPEDEVVGDAVWDYAKGKTALTGAINTVLDQHAFLPKMLLDAGQITQCDWGLDYSLGYDMPFPKLGQARRATFLLLALARRDFQPKQPEQTLKYCFAVYQMARHIDNDCIVSHLVGIAINAVTNSVLADLSAKISDEPILIRIKARVANLQAQNNTLKAAVVKESQMGVPAISVSGLSGLIKCLEESDEAQHIAKLKQADKPFFEKSLHYYLEYMANVQNALDLPYEQARVRLLQLAEQPGQDSKTNDHALITAVTAPALWPCYLLEVSLKTGFNALQAGLDLLLIKVRTGKLPETLPNNLPKDLFSGNNFQYEKSKHTFTLSYQYPNKNGGKPKSRALVFKFQ